MFRKAIATNYAAQISYNYLGKMNKSEAYSSNRLIYRIVYIIIDTYGNTYSNYVYIYSSTLITAPLGTDSLYIIA